MMGSSRQPSCLHHAPSPAERHGGRVDGAGAGQYHLARTGKRAMDVDARGWLTAARRQPSANFNQRPRGVAVDLLVVHGIRSEEHTSELQSRGHLVCRLLLEKKKHSIA